MLVKKKVIDYWIILVHQDIGLADVDSVKDTFCNLANNQMLEYFCIDDTGIFAYLFADDFAGNKIMSELLFYIKPAYRGSLKLVREYINKAENIAKENSCNSIKIGGNIGYKDDKFIRLLKRWGYTDDTLSKCLRD